MVTPLDRGLWVARWTGDTTAASYAAVPDGTRVDQWSSYDFVVPGVFLLTTKGFPVGTAARCPDGPDGAEPFYTTVTSQAVTPVDARRTVYYYSGVQPASGATPERLEHQLNLFGVAFNEDKIMIESQQKIIDRGAGKTMMTLSFDRPVARFRRLMADLIQADMAA